MSTRAYRQIARARAVEETRLRIARAFCEFTATRWVDDITLDDVATRAGVTVRTVIRQFGGKGGLVAAMSDYIQREALPAPTTPTNLEAALDAILDFHEECGDATIRALAQELRHHELSAPLVTSSAAHAAMIAKFVEPWLARLEPLEHQTVSDAVVIATDVYAWKRLRRDLGRTLGETRAVVRAMVKGLLDQAAKTSRH